MPAAWRCGVLGKYERQAVRSLPPTHFPGSVTHTAPAATGLAGQNTVDVLSLRATPN